MIHAWVQPQDRFQLLLVADEPHVSPCSGSNLVPGSPSHLAEMLAWFNTESVIRRGQGSLANGVRRTQTLMLILPPCCFLPSHPRRLFDVHPSLPRQLFDLAVSLAACLLCLSPLHVASPRFTSVREGVTDGGGLTGSCVITSALNPCPSLILLVAVLALYHLRCSRL